MGGCAVDDDLEFCSLCNEVKTVVLVGRTGNGTSATGNSIIGQELFDSMPSPSGVTATCQLQRNVLEDGQILNVIYTPGLFDYSVKHELIGNEIVKCISMAKDGIHSVLVVLSIRTRFSPEEASAIDSLRLLFGSKIGDYMIVVFAHGDALGKNMSLDNYLARCPKLLTETLRMCGNRCVLFENTTEDEFKKSHQRKELISLVNTVVDNNGGVPYTNELFVELKLSECVDLPIFADSHPSEISESGVMFNNAYELQLTRLVDMVESKLQATTLRPEKQFAEEQIARLQAEAKAKEVQIKSNDEIFKLREDLDRAHREAEELRKTQSVTEEELRKLKYKTCTIL